MPFNAKVKESGSLFEALGEKDSNSDVVNLEQGRSYWGYLYPGQFDPNKDIEGYIVFRSTGRRSRANFLAERLEQVQIPLRIKTREHD